MFGDTVIGVRSATEQATSGSPEIGVGMAYGSLDIGEQTNAQVSVGLLVDGVTAHGYPLTGARMAYDQITYGCPDIMEQMVGMQDFGVGLFVWVFTGGQVIGTKVDGLLVDGMQDLGWLLDATSRVLIALVICMSFGVGTSAV